ncbi:unnamed protein product [Mortierella alpina]
MEDIIDLIAEERDEIFVSNPVFRTALRTTGNSQTVSAFDSDINFVFDAAAFTKLLSEPISDDSSSFTEHLRDGECYSSSSPGVTGSILEVPNTFDNPFKSRPALLQHGLRMGARRSTSATLQAQEDLDQDVEQRRRESSAASSVVQHFSDLTIAHGPTLASLDQPASYENTHHHPQPAPASASLSSLSSLSSVYFPPSASALHQKRRKAKRHEIRAPRPKNCFMLYRSKVLPMIMVELGSINNKIISKIAAERWRAESEPVKTWYRQMAKQGKEEHARNHPGYKYAPSKKPLSMASASMPSRTDPEYRDVVRDEDDDDEDMEEEDETDGMDGSHVSHDQDAYLPDARRRSPRQGGVLGQSAPYDVSRCGSKGVKVGVNVNSRHRRPRDVYARSLSRTDNGLLSAREYAMDHSSSLCASDFYAAFPMSTTGYSSHGPSLPLMGSSLIEQPLYLQVQQPKYQQAPTPLLQHQDLPQRSAVQTSIPHGPSFYSLDADMNSSSSTLVDPVNNWMTHRYQDPGSLLEYLHVADANKDASRCIISDALQKSLGQQQAAMKGPMEMTHLLLDKDLPPLPFEISAQDSCLDTSSFNDPQTVLSHLYAAYNNLGLEQGFPLQLLASKECEPQMISMNDDDFGFNARLSGATASDELLGHHHQQQQQQYLIKPAYPTGFMSFTDIGEGAFSTMDMFTWPSQS